MDTQLILGLILTLLPVVELRAGLPVVIDYCLKNGISIWPYFAVVVLLNIFLILVIFVFLDYFHKHFLKIRMYRKIVERFINRIWKKAGHIEKRIGTMGYIALMIFVAVPLPGTGVWSGGIISWILKLDRLKSFIFMALGVLISGLIVLGISVGLFSSF